jgi:hypothetical protein
MAREEDWAYVLSGASVLGVDGRRIAVDVSPTDPLIVVISAQSATATLRYRASEALEACICGTRVELASGDAVVEFLASPATAALGAALVEVALLPKKDLVKLRIFEIGCG